MNTRCHNENHDTYKYYGARGITVCDDWACSEWGFDNFFEDMGPRPEGMTLDRINPHCGYTPNNCRWADSHTQAQNKRRRLQ